MYISNGRYLRYMNAMFVISTTFSSQKIMLTGVWDGLFALGFANTWHFPPWFSILYVTFFADKFTHLNISVHRWKGNKIPSLDIHFFTPRHTFSKRKWHEKREISFSPPKSGIPSSSYIFKTVHISEKWLWFSWSAPYFCLRKAGDNWNVARKCKNTQSYLPLIIQKLQVSLLFVIFFVTFFYDQLNNLYISVPR